MKRAWRRLKDVVVHRILGVDDTPHRIAFGVLLGFLVGWTPTLGLQIVIYVAIASLIRANKVSGIPILFISNPFTAVPLYWFAWWLGSMVLHGGIPEEEPSEAAVRERIAEPDAEAEPGGLSELFTQAFWEGILDQLWQMGGELWLGSLLMGLATGIPGYFITLWAVRAFRRRRG